MVISEATQILKDYNIFRPDYTYLLHWSTTQTTITAKKVSEALDVSEKTAQRMIDKMEECGLILSGSVQRKKRLKMSEIEQPDRSDPISKRFAYYVWDLLKKEWPDNKELDKAFLDVWEKESDLLIKERTAIEATETFRFVLQDDFWKTVILSVSNLRKKYDKIRVSMKRVKEDSKSKVPQVTITKQYLSDD